MCSELRMLKWKILFPSVDAKATLVQSAQGPEGGGISMKGSVKKNTAIDVTGLSQSGAQRRGFPTGGSGCDERRKLQQTCGWLPGSRSRQNRTTQAGHSEDCLSATLAAVYLQPHWHRGRYTITGNQLVTLAAERKSQCNSGNCRSAAFSLCFHLLSV